MNLKTLAVAALAAAGVALTASAADAKTRIRLGIELGGGCPPPYFDCYEADDGVVYGYIGDEEERPRRRRGYDDDEDFGYLSCGEARRVLRRQGWRRLEAQDCSGKRYRFTGWRHGEPFSIRISARSGHIISVRPLY